MTKKKKRDKWAFRRPKKPRNLSAALTRPEIAYMLGVSVPQIPKLEKRGMPVVRRGRLVRYFWQDVQAWTKSTSWGKAPQAAPSAVG